MQTRSAIIKLFATKMKEGYIPFKLPGSESPLKKSTSVTAIIHGGGDRPNNIYYVDSLERFRRDYASVEKQERDLKRIKDENGRARRRNHTIDREISVKRLEDGNVEKFKERQSHSLKLFNLGSKMTIHSHSSPMDPISLRYQNTEQGRQLQVSDRQRQVVNAVRAHKIQTFGSSGYNIINGQRNLTVEEMVPKENFGLFQQKLNNYYQKFRIKPEES